MSLASSGIANPHLKRTNSWESGGYLLGGFRRFLRNGRAFRSCFIRGFPSDFRRRRVLRSEILITYVPSQMKRDAQIRSDTSREVIVLGVATVGIKVGSFIRLPTYPTLTRYGGVFPFLKLRVSCPNCVRNLDIWMVG